MASQCELTSADTFLGSKPAQARRRCKALADALAPQIEAARSEVAELSTPAAVLSEYEPYLDDAESRLDQLLAERAEVEEIDALNVAEALTQDERDARIAHAKLLIEAGMSPA